MESKKLLTIEDAVVCITFLHHYCIFMAIVIVLYIITILIVISPIITTPINSFPIIIPPSQPPATSCQ